MKLAPLGILMISIAIVYNYSGYLHASSGTLEAVNLKVSKKADDLKVKAISESPILIHTENNEPNETMEGMQISVPELLEDQNLRGAQVTQSFVEVYGAIECKSHPYEAVVSSYFDALVRHVRGYGSQDYFNWRPAVEKGSPDIFSKIEAHVKKFLNKNDQMNQKFHLKSQLTRVEGQKKEILAQAKLDQYAKSKGCKGYGGDIFDLLLSIKIKSVNPNRYLSYLFKSPSGWMVESVVDDHVIYSHSTNKHELWMKFAVLRQKGTYYGTDSFLHGDKDFKFVGTKTFQTVLGRSIELLVFEEL